MFKHTKTIYIDMDGVLADFSEYYFKKHSKFNYHEFREEVMSKNLFLNLKPMADFNLLVSTVLLLAEKNNYNVEVLSSVHSKYEDQIKESKKQKRFWLDKHGLKDLKLNIVSRRSEKGNFSDEGNILIDDQMESVEYFNNMGGKGVLYTNAEQSIEQLKNAMLGLRIDYPTELLEQF